MDKNKQNSSQLNRAKYLVSRQALLDDQQTTEKQLLSKISIAKSKIPHYQNLLLERYVSLQDDLRQLKALLSKTPSPTDQIISTEQWDAKKATDELRALISSFNLFLVNTGFTPSI